MASSSTTPSEFTIVFSQRKTKSRADNCYTIVDGNGNVRGRATTRQKAMDKIAAYEYYSLNLARKELERNA